MPNQVTLVFRNPHEGQFSIENVFSVISEELTRSGCIVLRYVSPFKSIGFIRRFINCLHIVFFCRGKIHITGDVTYLAIFLFGRSLIVTFHDLRIFEERSGLGRYLIGLLWYRLPARRARVITAISSETKAKLVRYFGIPAESISVIPNPVDRRFLGEPSRPFNPDRGVIKILQVGTKENKNLDRLFKVLSVFSNEHEILLSVLGDLSRFESILAGLPFPVISFVNLSVDEVVEHYRKADVVSFVSTYEGFGLPIIEGQAVGVPVIVSAIEPMASIAGEGAIFVDPFSVSSILEGFRQLIENPSLVKKCVSSGLTNVERFSPRSVSSLYRAEYKRAV